MSREHDTRTVSRRLSLMAVAVATLGMAVACGELVTSPALEGTIRIEARSRQGAPLPGIKAILYTGSTHLGYAITDSKGNATLRRVPAGTYGVLMALPSEYIGFDEVGLGPRKAVAAPIRIRSQSDTTLAFTFLRPGYGTIVATVVDSAGNPFAGLQVNLYNHLSVLQRQPTDVQGTARFDVVPFGAYGVFVQAPDTLGLPGGQTVFVDTGLFIDRDQVGTARVVLARCQGEVAVVVRDDVGALVPGYRVELYTWVAVKRSGVTGPDGRVRFQNLACDAFGVQVLGAPGYTVIPTRGNGFEDGINLTHRAVIEKTLRVVRIP